MKFFKVKFNKVFLISIIIIIIGILISYIIIIPKNEIKVYSNDITPSLLSTIKNAILVKDTFIFTKVEYISLLQKSDKGLIPVFVEDNENITTKILDDISEEMLFLEYLVTKSPNKAKKYIDARIANFDAAEWKNLVTYANADRELVNFTKNKSKFIENKESFDVDNLVKEYNLNSDNNTLVTLNNRIVEYNIDNPYKLTLSISKYNIDNLNLKIPFITYKKYQGIYEAYTNKDCNNKSDKYGELKGNIDKNYYCEYKDASELKVQPLIREGKENDQLTNERSVQFSRFISVNLKNVKEEKLGILNEDLLKDLELDENTNIIIKLSSEIKEYPAYNKLIENGIIIKKDENHYLVK